MTYEQQLARRYAEVRQRLTAAPAAPQQKERKPRKIIRRPLTYYSGPPSIEPEPNPEPVEPKRETYVPQSLTIANPFGQEWLTILNEVAIKHDIQAAVIIGRSRQVPILNARHEAIGRIYREVRIKGRPPSLCTMGRWMNRDHTSIINSLRHCGLANGRRLTDIEAWRNLGNNAAS